MTPDEYHNQMDDLVNQMLYLTRDHYASGLSVKEMHECAATLGTVCTKLILFNCTTTAGVINAIAERNNVPVKSQSERAIEIFNKIGEVTKNELEKLGDENFVDSIEIASKI